MAHRYWRVRVTRAHVTTLTAIEIEFRSSPGGSNIAVGGTASASSFASGTPPENAFDGDPATFCNISASTGVNSMNQWIAYDLGPGNDAEVVEFTWTIGATASRNPRDCFLEFSDDGVVWVLKGMFTDVAGSASEGTTTYTVAVDLEARVLVSKTGFHIVQAQWGNERVTVLKSGYQAIVASFVEGVTVTKEGYFVALGPIDGGFVSATKAYAIFDQNEAVRISAANGYVVFRPIPPPPRKTIVIIGPGARFGGSGVSDPLEGAIDQMQDVSGHLSISHNLAAVVEQFTEITGDLYIDDGSVDHFLGGDVIQYQELQGTVMLPHVLVGVIEQFDELDGNLTVNNSGEPQYLSGIISQTAVLEADLTTSVTNRELPEFVAAMSNSEAGTSISSGIPPEAEVGDIVLAFLATRRTVTSITLPDGWSELSVTVGNSQATGAVAYRVVDGTEEPSYLWDTSTSGNKLLAQLVYRKIDTSAPITAYGLAINDDSGSWGRGPSVDIEDAPSLVVSCATKSNTAAGLGSPADPLISVRLQAAYGSTSNGGRVVIGDKPYEEDGPTGKQEYSFSSTSYSLNHTVALRGQIG